MKLKSIGLSPRVINTLSKYNIRSVDRLKKETVTSLLKHPNIGHISIKQIEIALIKHCRVHLKLGGYYEPN